MQVYNQQSISMWDHFSEYEAPPMASLKGTYPVAIDLRLKTSTYYGTTLATQRTSGFILNPLTAEATTLQSWCIANTNKIKYLPSMAAMKPLMLASATSSSSDPVKIINPPTLVEKLQTQLINIQGIARVVNFNQCFYYLACSLCNKASNAYQNEDLWCNYCAKKVAPLIRSKTQHEQLKLQSFLKLLINITSTAPGESLPTELLHKLSEPKNSSITLRAYMYTYVGISQLRFTVHSMSIESTSEKLKNTAEILALPPPTPAKKENTHHQHLKIQLKPIQARNKSLTAMSKPDLICSRTISICF
ncbi:hypothetical protein RHMOL_Rhmol01G0383400 [Rhododendron molle]|uniref:Uncharacterized protein n=2 Tax=Rhododendron molle TaxID=49168 RepID=A0ACC0QDL4_RHOML|nr:hypothetical protein RHMOL_Rhmol01G0383400 [Rhododendron molle]KAI8574824.1 hypothetical protein RHMOL_Rhmol01G0383400 [Rhododendron molle]